jgi:glycosyltransferase involved in cell wall biosynthesis
MRLIYDAHEFWPDADPLGRDFERRLLSNLERYLVRKVDGAVCVSPGLCDYMSSLYGFDFVCVPNAAPLELLPQPARLHDAARPGPLRFLYQGGYAPGRGLESMIRAWSEIDPAKAHLFLRGPTNAFANSLRELTRQLGLLDVAVYFLEPVSEPELVQAAAAFDVGLIPYEPILLNHLHCCPNKLSQYMQAGLMILASDTKYVSSIVESAKCGLVFEASNLESLRIAVLRALADPEMVAAYGRNARRYAETDFHWAIASRPYRCLWTPGEAVAPQDLAKQAGTP